ncbi:MAG: Glu/Leu/Phe/Val dehydrogenase dimerization domain-containing protein [Bacteroidota bacterium]
MKELLRRFEAKKPEIVFAWSDSETEAEGWVVINSLRGGAAGGGTRMRLGLDQHEVESLAKTMEVKFTISGPPIGGAKSGINFDPRDPRKEGVLQRWYKAVIPILKYYYGTGGDLNIDEIKEVIPITEDYGLWHPQEGIVNGHFLATEPQKIQKVGQLRQGVAKVLEDRAYSPLVERKYTVADMITGWGVAEAVRHYYDIWGGQYVGKRAIVQGFGNVGAAAAYYLAKMGVKIVGIIDRLGGLMDQDGLSYDRVRELFLNRQGNQIHDDHLLSFEEMNAKIWDLDAEIFIPAAASRLITRDQLEQMKKTGLEVISAGANVPFKDPEIFFGPTSEFADEVTAVIPDFIANCGMARVFAYLMGQVQEVTDEAIFNDVSETIRKALAHVHATNPDHTGVSKTALELALKQLV